MNAADNSSTRSFCSFTPQPHQNPDVTPRDPRAASQSVLALNFQGAICPTQPASSVSGPMSSGGGGGNQHCRPRAAWCQVPHRRSAYLEYDREPILNIHVPRLVYKPSLGWGRTCADSRSTLAAIGAHITVQHQGIAITQTLQSYFTSPKRSDSVCARSERSLLTQQS